MADAWPRASEHVGYGCKQPLPAAARAEVRMCFSAVAFPDGSSMLETWPAVLIRKPEISAQAREIVFIDVVDLRYANVGEEGLEL